jgi:hypothetical protein
MGFVHPDDHDLFVSYAHVNNQVLEGGSSKGWVTTLVRNLQHLLSNILGRDVVDVFFDPKLRGDVEVTPELDHKVRGAAAFLMVLSKGYLESDWCPRELHCFLEVAGARGGLTGRMFVVEFDRADRPDGLSDLFGYRFWYHDPDSQVTETLGFPLLYDKDRERRYFSLVTKLAQEMADALSAHKKTATCAATPLALVAQPPVDERSAVYLAEVTDDLEDARTQLQAQLEQAGFRTLPDTRYPREYSEYCERASADLGRSTLFIQLLSSSSGNFEPSDGSGKKLAGSPQSLVTAQYGMAQAVKTPILQWRRRELDLRASDLAPAHRRLLESDTVVACELAEFKALVVEQARKRLRPPSEPVRSSGSGDQLVFINAEDADHDFAKQLSQYFKQRGIAAQLPVWKGTPEKIRSALESFLRDCDAFILVHGDNPTWPSTQWRFYIKQVKPHKETSPKKAIGLCEIPPPDKTECGLGLPDAHVIDCRSGFSAEKFEPFVRALLPPGPAA